MTNDEEIDRLRELASKMLDMLTNLANGWRWAQLEAELAAVRAEAKQLNVE